MCGRPLRTAPEKAGASHAKANPARARRFAETVGPVKADAIDARSHLIPRAIERLSRTSDWRSLNPWRFADRFTAAGRA